MLQNQIIQPHFTTTIQHSDKHGHCEQCLKYLLDLRTSVAVKLPDDGTLVPKHVAVGT